MELIDKYWQYVAVFEEGFFGGISLVCIGSEPKCGLQVGILIGVKLRCLL